MSVEPLRKPEAPADAETQPGLDIVYARSLGAQGEHGSFQFRTMFGADTPFRMQEKITSGLMRLAEVAELRAKLRGHKKELALAEARAADPLTEKKARIVQIKMEMGSLAEFRAKRIEEMEALFHQSGRGGKFKPVGKDLTELQHIGQDIGKLESELKGINDDIDKRPAQLAQAIENWKVAIANVERDIGVLLAEANGE